MEFVRDAITFVLGMWMVGMLVGVLRPVLNKMGVGEYADYMSIGCQIFMAYWLLKHLEILTKGIEAMAKKFGG